jgi:hypothetical protein
MAKKKFRFDFALSFAGPQREIARAIYKALVEKGFNVFFDEDFEAEIIGRDAHSYLRKVYSEDSRYCIVLVSKEYDKRDWTKLEREIIQPRQLKSGHNILLPILTSNYKPDWLSNRICFNLRKRPIEELIEILEKKAISSGLDEDQERIAVKKNPYKVLIPYEEKDKDAFYGRENEVRNLFELIKYKQLTVVYGKSGIGKTSLLNAGLFPKLRESTFLPIRLHLNYSSKLHNLMEQIKFSIHNEIDRSNIVLKAQEADESAEPIAFGETLSEYFRRVRHFDPSGIINIVPVMVLDQFEEFFTLGKNHKDRKKLISELYSLIENQISDIVEEKIGSQRIGSFSMELLNIRVVICLREEYFTNLIKMLSKIPSFKPVAFRVPLLNGKQAREIIGMPGGIKNESLVNSILRYFYPKEVRYDEVITTPDEKLEIKPSDLSMLCYRLFETQSLKFITKEDQYKIQKDFSESLIKNTCDEIKKDMLNSLEWEWKIVIAKGQTLCLRRVSGVGPENIFINPGHITVGREGNNDVILVLPYISGHHAKISYTKKGLMVRDLKSMNGTYVNNKKIKTKVLKLGDVVRFSDVCYEVSLQLSEQIKGDSHKDETRFLIEKGRYWDAISIISEAEEQNLADENTRALKEVVIKNLSDDEAQSFIKTTKQWKSINYPDSGCTLGRDETIGSVIEIMDKIPIITVYGIPGIGKSVFIHEIRKSESHNNRLYKRIIAKPGMTLNDLFQQLALLLGCRDMLNQPEFDMSKQSDFSFLETEAQYRVASLIHLDDAQDLFHENQFRNNAVKEFLVAVTRYYPDTRIILECRIVPPAGIFPEKLHQSIRIHGIDKGSLILYFKQPFKNNPDFGWELEEDEQELVLKNLCSERKGNIHPLAMVLLANRAYQSNKSPLHIIKDPEAMKELIAESGDLILNDLNQTTMQATGPNMSQNIKMYNEDIPAYLSESLQKCIRELKGDEEIEDFLAAGTVVDEWEDKLRSAVSEKLYGEGWKHLQEIIKLDKERKERLKEEFGYIYDADNPEADEKRWAQKRGQIDWQRKVWQVLSSRNNFELLNLDTRETHEDIPEEKIDSIDGKKERKEPKKIAEKDKSTPGKIGEELEKAVLKLFKDFFNIWEEDNTLTITNARQQGKSLQFGHDLKFVCGIVGDKEIRFLIECKNYSEKIATRNIADKLMQVDEYYEKDHIDHWILISPNEDVSNELENFIESWEKKGKFSFKVQAWTPATRVKEFFGLDPDIYDKIIKVPDLEIHPKDWSEEKRHEVIEFWKKKLEPPLRLPQGWEDYLRYENKLLLELDEIEFERRYNDKDYVDMYCKDETGATLSQTLEEKLYAWLEEPVSKSPTLFLLGEFGDGKTFFTYVITRNLVEKFKKSPKDEWIPVRFALKNFESEKFNSIQEFIEHRLKDFRADIAGWNDLRTSGYKIMAILDGFDEISKELDPETIKKNIKILINCYQSKYLSKLKILITSRKHFFENHKEKDWLIDKLDYPQLLHLAPIDRKTTEDHLKKYAEKIGLKEKFDKLKECHDPIGLASKPLFLDMVQSSLKELKVEELNEYSLYETYILNSIKRKLDYLYDEKNETPKSEIIGNLLNVMELIAQTLHQRNLNFVYLSDVRAKADIKTWLWKISDVEANKSITIEKENTVTATRSLLRRAEVINQPPGKKRPVDFCHRSMREYFVARAVCNLIENKMKEAEEFLTSCFLSYEILFFASEIMKHRVFDYESNLLLLIKKTREAKDKKRVELGCLGGNAVNLLYQYKGELSGIDWSNLVLDGAILPGADLSGKDFSCTSLQYANLDNVNFTHSNFSNCNLTEVRIEETTPVQSIAISPGEKILSLYHDGIIREWSYQRPHGTSSNNLSGNKAEKDMKLMALPGNDLTILHDRYLYFYDRNNLNLDLKAAIEIKPNFRLVKATMDYLLLNEEDGGQNRLLLVDLNKEAIVKTFICAPFTLCDHLDDCALVIFNQDEELQLIDITPGKRTPLVIPTGQKVACISTCKCGQLPGQYLIGLGLYKGAVQIWQIQVNQWKSEKILDQFLHEKGKPVKDISFIDECRIVSGGLDKTIKLLTFNPDGQTVGDPKEFKMTLQCQGMKVDGVIREKIEGKKLKELIDKATK